MEDYEYFVVVCDVLLDWICVGDVCMQFVEFVIVWYQCEWEVDCIEFVFVVCDQVVEWVLYDQFVQCVWIGFVVIGGDVYVGFMVVWGGKGVWVQVCYVLIVVLNWFILQSWFEIILVDQNYGKNGLDC